MDTSQNPDNLEGGAGNNGPTDATPPPTTPRPNVVERLFQNNQGGPPQGGPPIPSANIQVAKVAVKLGPFWPGKAGLWFVQADAQFHLGHVTSEKTKFSHVVAMLDPATAEQVMDILVNPSRSV